MNKTTFDAYESNYDEALQRGLSLSGENKDFFALGRIQILARWLPNASFQRVLDYGCGTGSATPHLLALPGLTSLVGADVSDRSIARARTIWQHPKAEFCNLSALSTQAPFDLVFCNGVFHHIPVGERAEALSQIHRCLRSGGVLAFWENNPWNPGTRWVMSRIPFDREASLLWPGSARRLLSRARLEVIRTHFAFIFPKPLRWLRWMEWPLHRIPFGAQYLILARKPKL